MDYIAAAIASHEAAHGVACVLLGRQVISITRTGNSCGVTESAKTTDSVPLSGLVALIVPVYCSPMNLSTLDLETAERIFTRGADLSEAHRQARALVETPRFRSAHRAVEWALWSRQELRGAEVELIVAMTAEEGDHLQTRRHQC